MSDKSVPIWQVAEEFEKSIRGHETEIVAKKGDLQAASQVLAEKEKRLEMRSAELDNRKRNLDELEKGLQEQKEQSDRVREQLKARETRLEGIQDELETIRVRLEQKDKELAEMEKSLLEVLKRGDGYEAQLISALSKGKEHDSVMHQLEKEMRSAMETVLKVRQENLARESLLLELAQLVATAKGIVVDEQKRFMTWDARIRGRERAFDRTAETLKKPVSEGE